jgi:hypothetical protein
VSDGNLEPPRLAIWILAHVCPGDNDALTGDLIERFREGQTRGWVWRQVFITLTLGVLSEIRRHWPHFCYAIAGTVMPAFVWKAGGQLPHFIRWWKLPWPLSMFVLELSPFASCALAALLVLAVALTISRMFRWIYLIRTGVINLVLISLYHYLPDMFPSLLRQIADNPNRKALIIPPAFQMLLFFLIFWVAAWLGCSLPRNNNKSKKQVEA